MSIDRGEDKEDVVHIYSEYYSGIKKKEIMPFAATGMDLQIIILSEVRQRNTNIYYNSYEESSLKNDTKELIYKTEINLKISKTNLRLLLLLFSH